MSGRRGFSQCRGPVNGVGGVVVGARVEVSKRMDAR